MRRRRRSARSPWGFVAIGVGVVLAVGVPIGWSVFASSDVPADVGAGTAVELARESAGGGSPAAIPSGTASAAAAPTTTGSRPPSGTTTVRTGSPSTGSVGPTRSGIPSGISSGRPAGPPGGTSATDVPDTDTTGERTTRPNTSTRTAPSTVARPTASATPRPAVTGVPDRLQIGDLSVDAPVIPVGVDDRGDLAIPEDVGTVGWYRFGPQPGAASGSVVLAGHVDSATQGVGELRALWSAEPGMLVRVDLADGRPLVYRVVSREIFVKGQVPLDSLFSTTGAPRLTLITCGGPFDETTRSYEDNVVVTAVPA